MAGGVDEDRQGDGQPQDGGLGQGHLAQPAPPERPPRLRQRLPQPLAFGLRRLMRTSSRSRSAASARASAASRSARSRSAPSRSRANASRKVSTCPSNTAVSDSERNPWNVK